jgi:hypothetical protein
VLGIIVVNIDPVIHLGPLAIHWYGVMYAIAFYVAYRFAVVPFAQRAGVARDIESKIIAWTIVIGLIGGRPYVVQQPDLFRYATDDGRLHRASVSGVVARKESARPSLRTGEGGESPSQRWSKTRVRARA